jgi:hypothetical protein
VFLPCSSQQVKAVQEYLKCLSKFDLDRLSCLTTDNFTQSTLPTKVGVSTRTKSQDLRFLKELQGKVNKLHVSKSIKLLETASVLTASFLDSSQSTM